MLIVKYISFANRNVCPSDHSVEFHRTIWAWPFGNQTGKRSFTMDGFRLFSIWSWKSSHLFEHCNPRVSQLKRTSWHCKYGCGYTHIYIELYRYIIVTYIWQSMFYIYILCIWCMLFYCACWLVGLVNQSKHCHSKCRSKKCRVQPFLGLRQRSQYGSSLSVPTLRSGIVPKG